MRVKFLLLSHILMSPNSQRNKRNEIHIERARIGLREDQVRGSAESEADRWTTNARDEVRQAISGLVNGSSETVSRQEVARIEAERDGLLALLRAVASVAERMDRCETLLTELHQLAKNTTPAKEWYTVSETAAILNRAEFTVREWCRLGRVNAGKRDCGRGNSQEWIVSHSELHRIQNEGLLPD